MKLFTALLLLALPVFAQNVPEPSGYRDEPYRAPVPITLKGAIVLDTKSAFELWQSKSAVFIDALPHSAKPKDFPKDKLWVEKERKSIPNSIWLANVGYFALASEMDDYFKNGLDVATNKNKSTPLVFFCLENCWMSWNAAKRAMEYGYSSVSWYPDGTDGWSRAGYELIKATPWRSDN